MAEFGIDPTSVVGFTTDGASVMVAAGRQFGAIHQQCLGRLFVCHSNKVQAQNWEQLYLDF